MQTSKRLKSGAAFALALCSMITARSPDAFASAVPGLFNLTTAGATLAAGDAACPDQPHYLYAGGKKDVFAAPADRAYASVNLAQFNPLGTSIVAYDTPMANQHFRDSFNLQNNRSVCYAVVQFRAKATTSAAANDVLSMGHVSPGGTVFNTVASVTNPSLTPSVSSPVQSYALTATGRALLGYQTGSQLGQTPDTSLLDVFLQSNTEIDFFRIYIWYGPNCGNQIPTGC